MHLHTSASILEPIATFKSTIPGNALFGDGYGASVRFSGDWAFVAAPLARPHDKVIVGAVYVYKLDKNGYHEKQVITTDGTSDHLGLFNIVAKKIGYLFLASELL